MVEMVELTHNLVKVMLGGVSDVLTPEDISRIIKEMNEKYNLQISYENGELLVQGEGDHGEAYLDILSRIYEELKLILGTRKARKIAMDVLGATVQEYSDDIRRYNLVVRLPPPVRKFARTEEIKEEPGKIETPEEPQPPVEAPIETPPLEEKMPTPQGIETLPAETHPLEKPEEELEKESKKPSMEDVILEFSRIKGITLRRAKRLYHAEIKSMEDLKGLSTEKLAEILKIPETRAEEIYNSIHALPIKKEDIEREEVEEEEVPAIKPEGLPSVSPPEEVKAVPPPPPEVVEPEQREELEIAPPLLAERRVSERRVALKEVKKMYRKKAMRRRYTLLAALLVITFVVSGFIVMIYPIQTSEEKWEEVDFSKVLTYTDSPEMEIDGDVDIVGYGVAVSSGRITFMLKLRGSPFTGLREYGVLIDSDGNPSTGISMSEPVMGADIKVSARGKANAHSASWYAYQSGSDPLNWSAWKEQGKAFLKVEDKRVLLQVSRDLIGYRDATGFRFYSLGGNSSDLSDVMVSYGKPAVYMKSIPLETRVVNLTETQNLLKLILEAKGGDISLNLSYKSQNLQSITDAGVISLKKGIPQTIIVDAKGSGVPGGLAMLDAVPVVTGASITRVGSAYRGYVDRSPPVVTIDGAFADWDSIPRVKDPSADASDPDVDILSASGTNTTSDGGLGFYASVEGKMLSGVNIPLRVAEGGGGGGGGVIVIPRVSGEDAARFYIDADGDLSGTKLGDIYPEYMLEVKGINGKVTSSGAFKFNSGKWDRIGDIDSGVGISEVEVGVSRSVLGISQGTDVRVIAAMTSWNGAMDFTDSSFSTLGDIVEPLYWHERGMVNIDSIPVLKSSTINGGDLRGMAHADLDNDGDMDIISAQATNDVITAFRNNGDGTWTAVDIAVNGQGIQQTFDVTVGDIDRDGAVDIIVSNNGNDIFILRNPLGMGISPWIAPWGMVQDVLASSAGNVRAVGVADLDNDGDLDAIGGNDNGEIILTRNPYDANSNDPFTGAWSPWNYVIYTMPTGRRVEDLRAVDINNDGRVDIAAVSDRGHVIILRNPGNPFGNAWTSKQVSQIAGTPDTIAIVSSDIDHDGDPDMLTYSQDAGGQPNRIILWMNPFVYNSVDPFGAGVLWSSATIMSGGYRARALSVVDLDRDGFDDVIAGSGEGAGREVRVLENPHTSSISWQIAQTLALSANEVHAVDAIDWDKDGDCDIFFGMSSGELDEGKNRLVHRDAYSRFGVKANTSMHSIADIDVGDLDRDGDLDVVSAGGVWNAANEELWVYQNPGSASVSSYLSWPRTAVSTYTGGIVRNGVKLVDLDNDGWLDIAVANYWTNTVEMWAFWNDHTPFNGPWTTSNGLDSNQAYYHYGIDAADFDNDGDMDIVTCVFGGGGGARGRLWLWRNDGTPFNGGWTISGVNYNQQTTYPMLKVRAVDLDNNGWVDLVAGGGGMWDPSPYDSWNIFTFMNPAPGGDPFGGNTWTRVTLGALHGNTPGYVLGVDVSDLDNDGYADVVTCDNWGNTIAWWNDHTPFDSNGMEWLSVPVYSDPSYNLTAVAAGDMNNDGWADIVTGEKYGLTIISRNDWSPFDAPWRTEQVFNTSINITAISLADIDTRFDPDEDVGDLDIVLGGWGSISDPSAESPVVIWKNIGAMLNETVFDTAPAGIPGGNADDVMRIRVDHQGIPSDLDVEISVWRFYFYDAAMNPLTVEKMQGWFDYFNLSYDIDKDGVYTPGDPIIASVASSTVISNEVVFTSVSSHAAIKYGQPESYFLVVDTSVGGKGGIFRVGYDPDGYGTPYNYMNQNTSLGVATIEPTATIRESPATITKQVEIIPELNKCIAASVSLLPIVFFFRRKLLNKR